MQGNPQNTEDRIIIVDKAYKVDFGDLKIGDGFVFNNAYYLKTEHYPKDGETELNAVCLENGLFVLFFDNCEVCAIYSAVLNAIR